ncbi:endonuclease/exonuclease/phosphatase family protein [Haloechinothrix aidingensis]|uniref:endonuclease/exonuclease/phosphatase family protein n=1 Tax=Haloechinothrix aidingensis TaxID=2752311 RepID=UPI0031B61E79
MRRSREQVRGREQPHPRSTPVARVVTTSLVLLAVPFCAAAGLRLVVSGLLWTDGNRYTTALLALTPAVTLAGGLLGVLALVLRRWWIGGVVTALVVALVAVMLPRALPADGPDTGGATVRVLSVNLFFGRVDPEAVVELVREYEVDVLTVLELHPRTATELEAAGLGELLPHQHFIPETAAAGSGIASRYPLEELGEVGGSWFRQPSARVRLDSALPVEIVAVHTVPPVTRAADWRAELRALPEATTDAPLRILSGDFNATLDHAEFRRLLGSGYADAAGQVGKGLVPTWPLRRYLPVPLATLDHIVLDARASAREVDTPDVSGGDHRAVFAEIVLPG